MKALTITAGLGLSVGALTVVIAIATWPRAYFSTPDFTGNLVGLYVGAILFGLGISAGLLAMHASAITESHRKLAVEIARAIPLAQEERDLERQKREAAAASSAASAEAARLRRSNVGDPA